MLKKLKRSPNAIYHYADGKCVDGHPSGVRGDLSGVSGDLSGVRGNLSGVSGDLSGVWGDLSGVWGDLDECALTAEDRARGVDVEDLIGGE